MQYPQNMIEFMDFSNNTTPQSAKPLFILKPEVENGFLIFLSFWKGIWVILIIGYFVLELSKYFPELMSLGILIIPFVFLLGWIISFFLTQLELNNMQYKFYDTKVEYTDGFLIKNKKNIPYSRITDSMQGQTIVERLFGFWHITLETASNNLSMKYIQNSEENFEKINHIIHEWSKSVV